MVYVSALLVASMRGVFPNGLALSTESPILSILRTILGNMKDVAIIKYVQVILVELSFLII